MEDHQTRIEQIRTDLEQAYQRFKDAEIADSWENGVSAAAPDIEWCLAEIERLQSELAELEHLLSDDRMEYTSAIKQRDAKIKELQAGLDLRVRG